MDQASNKQVNTSIDMSIAASDDSPFTLTPKALFSILAIAFYWGTVFAAYWIIGFIPNETANVFDQNLCRAAGFLGQAVALGILFLLWKFLATKRGLWLLVIIAAILCPLGYLSLYLSFIGVVLPLPVTLVCIFLFGCGHACLLCRLSYLLDALSGPLMGLSLALAVLLSSALYVSSLMLTGISQIILASTMPFICIVFVLLGSSHWHLKDQDYHLTKLDESKNPQVRSEFSQFFVQVLFYSIVFSCTQFLVGFFDYTPSITNLFWVAVLLSGIAMLIYSIFVNRYVSLQASLWYMLPIVAIGLLPLPFAGPDQIFACWLLIVFGFTFFDMMSLYHLSSFIKFNNLAIIRYFALGRFANASGIAVGWFFGFVMLAIAEPTTQTIGLITISLVILLICMLTFFARPGSRKYEENILADEVDDTALIPDSIRRPWRECIDELSKLYGLSPREGEVFALLSRGRSTRYISEKLFVSQATVKTHVYRIYRKLDVTSQQEVIDLIESYFRSNEPQPHSSHEDI